MGGTGSGNYGGRPTVESALMLDLSDLIRQGIARSGPTSNGFIVRTDTSSGRETARINFEAHMSGETGWIRLRYTTTNRSSGETADHDQRVDMTTTAQPFGGRRWWWICPRRGELVAKLYLPARGGIFASRRAHRLAYRSQRQSLYDRAISQAFKRRQRLGADGGIGDPIDKPKGMRWATFDHKMDQVEAAEAVCNARLFRALQQLTGRGKRSGILPS